MACYIVSFVVAQVGDWTYKVAKMKENPDFAESWTSHYPYKDIFNEYVGLIKAFMSKDKIQKYEKF